MIFLFLFTCSFFIFKNVADILQFFVFKFRPYLCPFTIAHIHTRRSSITYFNWAHFQCGFGVMLRPPVIISSKILDFLLAIQVFPLFFGKDFAVHLSFILH